MIDHQSEQIPVDAEHRPGAVVVMVVVVTVDVLVEVVVVVVDSAGGMVEAAWSVGTHDFWTTTCGEKRREHINIHQPAKISCLGSRRHQAVDHDPREKAIYTRSDL